MLLHALFLACSTGLADASGGDGAYLPGMWEARAMTVESGIDEALVAWDAGDRSGAAETIQMVYEGSFEPELEPTVRELVSPRDAVELEYRFGALRQAMAGRDRTRVEAAIDAMRTPLRTHAATLDDMRAVLN
ncbi:MAG: hypothetical protein GY913_26680 [Proteobacteria bacterium]|nr:hypothetical protein [Pseudomonadota bacterium]MCP4920502.1 hypothetical protein [Pseudomonadota bacterium]